MSNRSFGFAHSLLITHHSSLCTLFLKVRHSLNQSLAKRNGRIPAEQRLRARDVGLALFRIVLGQWQIFDAGVGTARLHNLFRQFLDRKLTRVAEIDRIVHAVDIHQPNQCFDQIVDITERTRLIARAIER